MDRFIANIVDVGREVLGGLKSNMDRFIARVWLRIGSENYV